MGKGTKDVACFSKELKQLKKRSVEDYKINGPIVDYNPQMVRDSLAKVLNLISLCHMKIAILIMYTKNDDSLIPHKYYF